MTKSHKLNLLNNSTSYFREAVRSAQINSKDTEQWKFAIIHVVQAMELAFKEFLRRIHPVFVLDSIDKPDKTVSMRVALDRIRNPSIGNLSISENEKVKIHKAFDLRNELTHYEFDADHDHIESKFAEIFSFMIFFYREHLKLSTEEFIDEEQLWKIVQTVRTKNEMLARARDYLNRESAGSAWICPSCSETTFLIEEQQCCFCHHKERILECKNCIAEVYERDVIDVSDLFDWGVDEGQVHIIDDFGLEHSACPSCIDDLRDQIRQLRLDRYFEEMQQDSMS